MKLPQELFDDIENFKVAYWHDQRFVILFERFIELKEYELKKLTLPKIKKMWKDMCRSHWWNIKEMEADHTEKQDYINDIIEDYKWSEKEFIDWCVGVYMWD